MKKIALNIVLVFILILNFNTNTFADETNSLSDQLTQTQKEKSDLQNKVNKINNDIDDIIKKIDINKESLNKLNNDTKNTQLKLDATEKNLAEEQILLNRRIRAMYMCGSNTSIEVILSAQSMSDFLSKMDMLAWITDYDNKIIASVKKQRDEILVQKKQLEEDNAKLTAIKSSNEVSLATMNKEIKEQKIY